MDHHDIPVQCGVLKFPEAVEIAVFPCRDIRRLDGETRLRRLTRCKELSIDFPVGKNLDPFDVMLLLHGMGDTAYLHLHSTRYFFHDRNMLFLRSIRCVLLHQFHGLAAAHWLACSTMQDLHNIAANSTFVNFVSRCHSQFLS